MRTAVARLVAVLVLVGGAQIALGSAAGGQPTEPLVVPGWGGVTEGDGESVTLQVPVRMSEPSADIVTVQWETLFGPGVNPPDPAEPGLDYTAVVDGLVTFVPGDTEEMVSITVLGEDLVEADEFVVVRVHSPTNARMGGFWGLGFGLILNDDQPPPPTITVTPSTDLDGGDVVTVSGSSWRPNYTVGLCQADAMLNDPPDSRCRERVGGGPTWVGVATDSQGDFSADYRIDRWIDVEARGGFIDCIDPATPCVMGAGEVNSGVPDGPIVSVPLSFADPPTPPATRGVVTVTPSTDLIWGETLTVTGSGFRSDAEIEVYPCLDAPTLPSDCALFFREDTTADGGGAFETTMPASRFILGGMDCGVVPCAIGAVEAVDFVGTVASTPIAYAPPIPRVEPGWRGVIEGDGEAVTLEVPVRLSEPTTVTVTAQWETRFGPGVEPPDPAEPGLDFVAVTDGLLTFVPGDTEEMVSIEVLGEDLVEADELVVVKVHSPTNAVMGGFWGLGFGLILNDDQPPPPTITVTPSADLDGGDIVTVTGTHWPANVSMGFCQADAVPADPLLDGCRGGTGGTGSTTTDAQGQFSIDFRVLRWMYVPARGGFIDCTDPATPCAMGASEIIGSTPVGPTATASLPFADPPPPPATRGVILVEPSVDVGDGETLTITGTGFRADANIELFPCLPPVDAPNRCDWGKRVDVAANGGGAFTATMPASRFIFGTQDCAARACVISASEAVDFVGTFVTAGIAFAPPP